ncbi:MAG: OmpW family outer membrane protein [Pseudomonadota bacterium]
MTKKAILVLATSVCALAGAASAQSQGDWKLGVGLGWVSPEGGSSMTAAGSIDVDPNLRPTITAEYFIFDNVGIELLASWPFEHDINLAGAGEVATTKHLPPTLSIQYHFTNKSNLTPFVGVGVNYTHFFDETGRGALAGADVSLDDSFGLALHAGLDYDISARGAWRADIRWINIETDVAINGADIGTVDINPIVLGAAYIFKF